MTGQRRSRQHMRPLPALVAGLLFLFAPLCAAQQITLANSYQLTTEINTAGRISIIVGIKPALDGKKLDEFIRPVPAMEMRDQFTGKVVVPASSIQFSNTRTQIELVVLVGPSLKSFLEAFNRPDQSYLFLSDSLKMTLDDGSVLIFTPEKMQEISSQQRLELTPEKSEELIAAKGGYVSLFNNQIDAGVRDAPNDSVDTSGYIDFTFAKPLFRNTHAQISGLLTSDLNDDVANIKITPFSFRSISKHTLVMNTFFQSSLNGNEVRVAGSLFYNGIFPNFIDLTQGHNRLRPKPLISAGLNLSYYADSAEELVQNEVIAEPFIDLLYRIPIMDKYTLNLEMHAFWRSDNNLNFDTDRANWHWNIALAYTMKNTAKIISKYSYGTDSFTMQTDNRLMLGFLLDLIEQ